MAKKSHRIASRQAAVSKERKKKKKAQTADKRPVSSTEQDVTIETSVGDGTEGNVTVTVPRAAAVSPKDAHRYDYVYPDLKRIAYIAIPLVILIIILAFVI